MTNKSLTKQQTQAIADSPKQISVALREFQDESKYHLLGPKTHLGSIPGGTSLSIREVKVDAKDESQVYGVGGDNLALTGFVLGKLGAAAGATTVNSERVDDRRHPHYWEFAVRCRVTDLDGSIREEVGSKTIDMREEAGAGLRGKDLQATLDDAAKPTRRNPKGRDPAGQVSGARKFGSEMCESKAKNRAVSKLLGIKRSYTVQELNKPFIVPKLVPDGGNPASQQAILANMMGAASALYTAIGSKVVDDGQIVDAEFEDASEPPAAPESDTPAAAATVPDDGEDPHDADGVVDDSARVKRIVVTAWRTGRVGGIDDDTFKTICQKQTGLASQEGMTIAQAESVASAVKAFIANADKCPV